MNKGKLDPRVLIEAIKIYYEIAWGELPDDDLILRRNANYLSSRRGFSNSSSSRLGRSGYIDMKLVVHYIQDMRAIWAPDQEYSLSVFTNDRGIRQDVKDENQRLKEQIESAWREAGYPVRPQ